MPWEKSFDLDDAVDRAARVFWAKGYEATSMADLVEGMGINKGSLYNAFGNKKALFQRALLKYDQDNRQKLITHLDALDDPVTAIERLFDTMIADSAADPDKKGCMIVNTALELPCHDADTGALICAALGDFEAFFRRQIRQGQERGAIAAGVDPDQTAKALLAMVVGLRVLARGAFDIESLKAIRKDALRLVAG